jgi:hypothetical protein
MIFKSVIIFGQDKPLRMSRIASFGYFEWVEIIAEIIPNHPEIAVNLLIEQFKNSTNLKNLIRCQVLRLQELEDVIQAFFKIRDISQAFGDNLNIIGEVVGEDRLGLNDSDYRIAIRNKILLNHSYGQPEILITAINIVVKAKRQNYREFIPAIVYIDFNTNQIPSSTLKSFIESIALAGVKIILKFSANEDYNFAFKGENGLPDIKFSMGFAERDNGFLVVNGGRIMDLIF